MNAVIAKFKNHQILLFLRALLKYVGARIYNFMPKTMMGRSLLIIVTPILLLQVILGVYFYQQHWKAMASRLSGYLVGDIHFIIELKKNTQTQTEWEALLQNAQEKMDLRISFREDEILPVEQVRQSLFTDTKLEKVLRKKISRRIQHPYSLNLWSFEKDIEIKIQLDDGVLRVLTKRKRLFSSTLYVILIWMIVASLVLTAISVIFMSNQIRPIRRLAKSAEAFGKGQSVKKLQPFGSIEIRKATMAFNDMSKRIIKQIHQRTEMLAGVSHDLRTPLTRMSLQLALLEDGKPVATEEIENFKSDIVEMEKMIEGYLSFAQGESLEENEVLDVGQLLNRIFKKYIHPDFQMSLHVEDQLYRDIKPNSFTRCLENLMTNATRYANKIAIRAWKDTQNIYIQIDDNGPGIEKDQIDKVFRPFYRIDPSRSKETGGIGLGLTIAKDVINSHGGSIKLKKSKLGGLCVLLTLPV